MCYNYYSDLDSKMIDFICDLPSENYRSYCLVRCSYCLEEYKLRKDSLGKVDSCKECKNEKLGKKSRQTFENLTGQSFSNLIVKRDSGRRSGRSIIWECECQCEPRNIVFAQSGSLKNKTTQSCGKGECSHKYVHGKSKTVNYNLERVAKRREGLGSSWNYQDLITQVKNSQISCVYCETMEDLSVDHIIPIAKSGTNNIKNLTVACRSCNSRKTDFFLSDWLPHHFDVRLSSVLREYITFESVAKKLGFDSWQHYLNYESNYR